MSGCSDPQGCEDCGRHLYEYQHSELEAELRSRIEAHLAQCDYCSDWFQEEEVIRRRVKQCADEAAPEQLRLRVVAYIATFRMR